MGSALFLAAIIYVAYDTAQGWRTGRIGHRALKGDRKESPHIYWFLMAVNAGLLIGCLLAVLGIYGEPI
ncbi:MAG TPA: hypothetical protein VF589_06670 [Allosphingosinicella sp.]|jgi:hypothetical protein